MFSLLQLSNCEQILLTSGLWAAFNFSHTVAIFTAKIFGE